MSPSACPPEPLAPSNSIPRASSSVIPSTLPTCSSSPTLPTQVRQPMNTMNPSVDSEPLSNSRPHVACSLTLVQPQMNTRTTFQEHPCIPIDQELHKEPCIVEGCKEHIAPSMWLPHMTSHAKGVLPGVVPSSWLRSQSRFICPNCSSIVSNSHFVSHARKCPSVACGGQNGQTNIFNVVSSSIPNHQVTLPSLEDICSLKHPTIRFIPSSARPAFARVLSSVLKEIVAVNSVAAWTKLLMLPKCVLPNSKRGGRHNKPISIDILCDMWLKGNLCELWHRAQTRATISTQSKKVLPNKRVDSAIALAKDGLYSKACQMLTSQGVAPDDDNTWNLLISKHPQGECPSNLPIPSTVTVLPHDFNIVPVLRSFSKLTGAGPTGLRIQHLIDAVEVLLSCSILQSLKGVVNILAAGRVPPMIASFLAGGNLTALVKSTQGSSFDIRPIAVGEALRRLTGKCLCALVRSKASEFFQPHQFGVACPMGAEKIVHGLRACVEKHWLEENFVVLKVDMKNAFNLVSRQALLSECAKHFPELYPWAHCGVIASTHTYGTRWGI